MQSQGDKIEITQKIQSLGKGLKKLRKEKGYSNYQKLAYDLDMSHSQYGSYENGRTNITFATLIRILNFHKVSLTDFILNYFDE